MSRVRSINYPIPLTFALLAALVLPLVFLSVARNAHGFDYVRVLAWVFCTLGTLGVCGCVGVEINGRVGGVLIDERNRYSLSRLQMMAWTVLLFSSLYTLVVANALRGDAALAIMKIEIDWNLVAASGFSLVSLVGAPMALSRKADAPSSASDLEKANAQLEPQQKLSQPLSAVGRVVVKGNIDDARFADLFRGEDVQNATLVDLPRLQMLLVSTVVILGYCFTLIAHLGATDAALHSLPAFSPTVLSLILISHTGYLVGKVIPTSPASTSTAADQSARVLVVAKEATDLSGRVDALLAQTPPASPLLARLQQILADVRLVASDANAWTSSAPQARIADPQALEQRLVAVQSAFAIAVAQRDAATDAPDSGVIRQVQDKLIQQSYGASRSGADDSQTRAAIADWMAATQTDATSLATSRKRFYEELLQLI